MEACCPKRLTGKHMKLTGRAVREEVSEKMNGTTNGAEYSQPRTEDYLRENKLEAKDNARVYSRTATPEKEGDGAKVGGLNHNIGEARESRVDLLEKVLSPDNLNAAYKQVKRNKGSHGVDGMTVKQLLPYLLEHGRKLSESILEGTYKPQPVRRVEIPKPDGGVRLEYLP